jgi:DNA-binding response OmpR family regulator
MRILIVEESSQLQHLLGTALRKAGYVVDIAGDGEEGLQLAGANGYAMIVLEIALSKLDGLSLLLELRRRGQAVHVLFLTARDAVPDRVRGLQAGADDYMTKPFALDELLARVQAVGRRINTNPPGRILVGGLEIDLPARCVRMGGQLVELTAREFLLLECLAHRRSKVVSRADLEAHIYDDKVEPMSNVVASTICSLRKKFGATGGSAVIQTRGRLGYALDESTIALGEVGAHPA